MEGVRRSRLYLTNKDTPEELYRRNTLLRNNRVPKLEEDKEKTALALDLSVLENTKHDKYSAEQKISAVTYYALTGNLLTAADRSGVPWDLVRQWKTRSTWWDELLQQIKQHKMEEFDAKASAVVDDCLAALMERVQKGEEIVLQNGQVKTKSISARDLAYITSVLFDKRQLARGAATSIKQTSSEDMLKKLKKDFEKMAKDKEEKEPKTIEGERVE